MTSYRGWVHLMALTVSLPLTGCDPVHSLKLENKSSDKVEVVFYPELGSQDLGDKQMARINFNGRELNTVTLNSAEIIRIGTVTARYNPRPDDVDLDYLEVRMRHDTLRLTGKTAIFSTLQKVGKLDWRIIIRSE